MSSKFVVPVFVVALGLMARPVQAQQDTMRIARLESQLNALTRELEELRLGGDVVAAADRSQYGLGPAASKVYRVRSGVSVGGYGEVVYQNFASEREDGVPSGMADSFDALRAILYLGYRFNDKLLFNSEIEVEHGGTEHGGAVALEFAYLDYRLWKNGGVRAGQVLMPMGFINELHEPPAFFGVQRPLSETQIIPSTWHENGIGIFGEQGRVSYRAYLVNGFNGAGFEATGLRGGRQDGAEAIAKHWGGVGRVEFAATPGLTVAASGYIGNSGQSDAIKARTSLVEGHAEYRRGPLELRGLVTAAFVKDAGLLNNAAGLTGAASIGERLVGWYLQGGYDVLASAHSSHQLIPYARYEQVNTQDRVPTGFAADPANDRQVLTLGTVWKPVPNISLKADYQIDKNQADTGINQLNVALGYLF